jgi:hypothetical protein
MSELLKCRHCQAEMPSQHLSRRYCNWRCKRAYQKTNGGDSSGANCRQCGIWFPKGPGQHAKAICSAECRRARLAESVRTFHLRRPTMQQVYRQRAREKQGPDSNLKRFRRSNPNAPTACESCGERRVLDVAHKPSCPRLGEHRSARNCKWPEQVWVLCPTCHALLDRMRYPPAELGLKE